MQFTLPTFVGALVLIGALAGRWEFRRKEQRTASDVWRFAVWVLVPLAVVLIALGWSGHHLADDVQVVLTLGFAGSIAAASIGQRRADRGGGR